MFYIIVKGAMDGHWEKLFKKDPKLTPLNPSLSAYYTYLGKSLKCRVWYSEERIEAAKHMCEKLNLMDQEGGYALCTVKE